MKDGFRQYRPDERRGPGIASPLDMIEGVLATSLNAASGATGKDASQILTGSTTATLNLIAWSDDNTFFLTGDTATITNRSDQFSAGAGSYLVAFKIGGEFRPLSVFQTVRGRLLKSLETDDATQWPAFGLMQVLGPGRIWALSDVLSSSSEFSLTASTTTGFTITGDHVAEIPIGRRVTVANSGDADGQYTVTAVAYSDPSTSVDVVETVPDSTIGDSSTLRVLGVVSVNGDVTTFLRTADSLTVSGVNDSFTVDSFAYDDPNTTITLLETVDAGTLTVAESPDYVLTSALSGYILTVTTDVRADATPQRYVVIEDAGASDGVYTVEDATYLAPSTTITVEESVGTATISGSSHVYFPRLVEQNTIHPSTLLTYDILSLTVGATGDITISSPAGILSGDDPICECDMFEEGHEVIISGSENGLKDGTFRCRKCFSDVAGIRTIYLDGEIVSVGGGAMGIVTLKVPPPLVPKRKSLAVLRWYRTTLPKGAIVHTLPPDGGGWHEIIASDIGPSSSDDPEEP